MAPVNYREKKYYYLEMLFYLYKWEVIFSFYRGRDIELEFFEFAAEEFHLRRSIKKNHC